jgi:CBS-domain-containing membrane protein
MKLDEKSRDNWKDYILQSAYAAFTVLFITLILKLDHAVIIASIGATAFIVFSMPNNIASEPKRIIGGHTVLLLELVFQFFLFRICCFFLDYGMLWRWV